MELLQTQSPQLQEVLTHPENLKILKDIIGLDNLEVPGESSRDKQWRELVRLLEEPPLETEDGFESSIEIGIFDLHSVELEILSTWINSPAGQMNKEQNSMGYTNVHAHAMQHQQALEMMERRRIEQEIEITKAMSKAEAAGKPNPAKKEKKNEKV